MYCKLAFRGTITILQLLLLLHFVSSTHQIDPVPVPQPFIFTAVTPDTVVFPTNNLVINLYVFKNKEFQPTTKNGSEFEEFKIEIKLELIEKYPSYSHHHKPKPSIHLLTEEVVVRLEEETFHSNLNFTFQYPSDRIIRGYTDNVALNLTLTPRSGISESQSQTLSIQELFPKILVQLDKPIYRPGETIRFRIIVGKQLDTSYWNDKKLSIEIKDPNGHLVKSYYVDSLPDSLFGLHKGNFSLGSESKVGNWELRVQFINRPDTASISTFKVSEYVLPAFSISLKSDPSFLTFNATKFTVEATGTFNFGGGVEEGKCKFVINNDYGRDDERKRKTRWGSLSQGAEFDLNRDLKLLHLHYGRLFTVEVTCTEESSKLRSKASIRISLFEFPYKMVILASPRTYKPGVPFEMKFQLSYHNGTGVSPSKEVVTIHHGFTCTNNSETKSPMHVPLGNNGEFSITFHPSDNELVSVEDLKLTYENYTQRINIPKKKIDDSGNLLTIEKQTNRDNNVTTLLVETRKPVTRLVYYVVRQEGKLLWHSSESFLLFDKTQWYIHLRMPEDQGERWKLIVVAYGDDDPLLIETLDIIVKTRGSDVFLNCSKSSVQPGEEVTFFGKSAPGSLVALRAVDKAVEEAVFQEEGSRQSRRYGFLGSYRDTYQYHHYHGRQDDAFGESGFRLYTNARMPSTSTNSYQGGWGSQPYGYGWGSYHANAGTKKATKKKKTGSKQQQVQKVESTTKTREDFPETWIFSEISTNPKTGDFSSSYKAPDSITTYNLDAFGIDPHGNTSPLPTCKHVKVFQDFFLAFTTPYSMFKGEEFTLPIRIHNYMESGDVQCNVSLSLSNGGDSQNASLLVPTNSVRAVDFQVIPQAIGRMEVKAEVRCINNETSSSDAVVNFVSVLPPGLRQDHSQIIAIPLATTNVSKSLDLKATFPVSNRVEDPGADSIKLTLSRDVASLNSLGQDETEKYFIPRRYSSLNDHLNCFLGNLLVFKKKDENLVSLLESQYQTLLSYSEDKEGFQGSTALTAKALLVLILATQTQVIFIDQNLVNQSVDFLIDQQADDGYFIEGEDLRSSNYTIWLSAQALSSLLLLPNKTQKIEEAIQSGLSYLHTQNPKTLDNAALISVTGLMEPESPGYNKFFKEMNSRAFLELQDGSKFWPHRRDMTSSSRYDTLSTSDAFLVHLHRYERSGNDNDNDFQELINIFRWLLHYGGSSDNYNYDLCSDASMFKFQAMVEFRKLLHDDGDKNNNATVGVSIETVTLEDNKTILLSSDNLSYGQETTHILPSDTRHVRLNVSGKGSGMLVARLSWSYYTLILDDDEDNPTFKLAVKVTSRDKRRRLFLGTCVTSSTNSSEFIVLTVKAPTGYIFNHEDLVSLKSSSYSTQAFYLEEGNSKVVVHQKLESNQKCLNFSLNRVFKVTNYFRGLASVFDFYDVTRRVSSFYTVPEDGRRSGNKTT